MTILVIGHRGYLGAGLFDYFKSRGHRVLGWDKEEDLFALDSAALAREKVEAVVNLSVLAEFTPPAYQIDTPGDKVNVGGARHLARILKGTDIAWFQLSTREVFNLAYGPKDVLRTKKGLRPKFLVGEDTPFGPRNPYGKSKLMAEFISESHPKSDVIRLTTCYTDAYHPAGSLVLQLLKKAARGEPVTLTRGGLQFRDPLHINDLGGLVEKLVERGVYGEKFHAGGGKENLISLKELVRLADPKAKIVAAPGGDYGFAFDGAKALKLAGWKPRVLIRERIPRVMENVRRGLAQSAPVPSAA